MVQIRIEETGQVIETLPGRKLLDICDETQTPIQFGCRAASCGICLVEIRQGMENLDPAEMEEQILLEAMADDPATCRLACQCVVQGPITLKVVSPG